MFNDQSISMDHPVPEDYANSFPETIHLGNGTTLTLLEKAPTGSKYQDFLEDCPYWAAPGYEGCEEQCIWAVVFDDDGNYLYDSFCCGECSEGKICESPSSLAGLLDVVIRFYALSRKKRIRSVVITATSCEYESGDFVVELPNSLDPIVAALTGGRSTLNDILNKSAGPKAQVTVQSVANPADFTSVRLNLDRDLRRVRIAGWWLVLTRLRIPNPDVPFASPVPVTPLPAVTPTSQFDVDDVARSAAITLPENGAYQQYWVTVPDSSRHPLSPYRYAYFTTKEWSVLLLRDPIEQGSAGAKRSGCGCDDAPAPVPASIPPHDVPPAGNS